VTHDYHTDPLLVGTAKPFKEGGHTEAKQHVIFGANHWQFFKILTRAMEIGSSMELVWKSHFRTN
jgi:hypothetical protein